MNRILVLWLALVSLAMGEGAGTVAQRAQARIDEWVEKGKVLARSPAVVDAVHAQNSAPSATVVEMTQSKWEALPELHAVVRGMTTNAAALELKKAKSDALSEAFVSDASGRKVAFLAKSTNWSHAGKPKHEIPMSGEVWKGRIELDRSTGRHQVQIGLPVLKDDKVIGSLVLGISLTELASE
jgi:hypothetical protein